MHPTKSVCAIGPLAEELTSEHHKSIYPYDVNSPYYKLTKHNAKIIGLGVKTTYLSAVHCADDFLKDDYPVDPYHKMVFEVECVNYSGEKVIVKTLAHDMKKMDFDLPKYFSTNIPDTICKDININGANFFRAEAAPLIQNLINLAKQGNTIYKRKYYKR